MEEHYDQKEQQYAQDRPAKRLITNMQQLIKTDMTGHLSMLFPIGIKHLYCTVQGANMSITV